MARKFEKFQTAEKQYGLRATSPVSPGEVLYVAEPYAYTVTKSAWGRVCEFCLSSSGHLLRCSQCKFAKYCGKQCQTAAWQDHKRECKCIRNHTSSLDTDPVRLVGKIIFKMLRKLPCPSEELCSLSDLEPILTLRGSPFEEEILWLKKLLLVYLKEEIPHPSQVPADITALFAMVTYYRLTMVSKLLDDVAVGLYPSISLVKYSCEPNCTAAYKGRLLHLRAIRNIEAGEVLTMAVVDPMMPTKERQALLMKQYCYNCDCRRCQTNYMDEHKLAGDKEASNETEDMAKRVLELQKKEQWDESLALCKAQLQRNVGRVPDENIYQLKILDYAYQACLTLLLPEEAAHYGYRTMEPYWLYNRGISPTGALQIMNLGPLLSFQGKMCQRAQYLYKEAIEDMKVFYGTDHPMTKIMIAFTEIWSMERHRV